MSKDMYLVEQVIDILTASAIGKEYYGKELSTYEDIASVMNTLDINKDRKKPITANYIGVAIYRVSKLGLLDRFTPDWEEIEKTHKNCFFCNAA